MRSLSVITSFLSLARFSVYNCSFHVFEWVKHCKADFLIVILFHCLHFFLCAVLLFLFLNEKKIVKINIFFQFKLSSSFVFYYYFLVVLSLMLYVSLLPHGFSISYCSHYFTSIFFWLQFFLTYFLFWFFSKL